MLKRVHHVGYVVRDIRTVVDFMQKYFGLAPIYQGLDTRGDGKSPHALGALYDVGGAILEFEQPLDESSTAGQQLKQSGPGLLHVAYEVEDIKQTARQLGAIDPGLLAGLPRVGPWGYKTLNFSRQKTANIWLQLAEGNLRLPGR